LRHLAGNVRRQPHLRLRLRERGVLLWPIRPDQLCRRGRAPDGDLRRDL